MKPKKDILVFTRKLLESLKLWGVLEKKDPIVDPGQHALVPLEESKEQLNLVISVDHAMRLKNPVQEGYPPNSYVVLRPDFPNNFEEWKTEVVY